jgi:integrase
VQPGRISRRKGRSKPYSPTTVADYARAYRNFLRPEFGPVIADDIGELEWQMWCDRLQPRRPHPLAHIEPGRCRLGDLRLGDHPDPTLRLAKPAPAHRAAPNDERPRLRVAFASEAEQLLAALEPEDALPYTIAFYAGLRRSEVVAPSGAVNPDTA